MPAHVGGGASTASASLAAPLAVWRGDDADAVTGEPIAEPDGGSVDANVRDDVLARAEKILTELAESTFAAVAAAAAAEQERIDARRAKALEAREAREAACNAARGEDGVLPAWESKKAHKGHEHFVLHKGRECVTKPSSGQARPLCKCGMCFLSCRNFQDEYALGCVHNPTPPCATTGCPQAAQVQGYCSNCSKRVGAVAQRKAERESELLALMAQHGIARAPDDIHEAEAGTPYAQQNPQADWAPRIVLKRGSDKWMPGCMGVLEPGKPPGPCAGGGLTSTKLYDWHCVRCFIASYPNDVRAVNAKKFLKAKELAVREYLEATFPDYKWVFDRAFAVGVRKRPDAKVVVTDRVVIDEANSGCTAEERDPGDTSLMFGQSPIQVGEYEGSPVWALMGVDEATGNWGPIPNGYSLSFGGGESLVWFFGASF